MPSSRQVKLPTPQDWQEFQRMTCDLFRQIWRNLHAQEYGTLGERQNGVDVYGVVGNAKKLEGVQCKVTNTLKVKDVRDEYAKSLIYRPKLSRFIIATTASRNTAAQAAAVTLTQGGGYPCELMFWEDFCQRLADHPKLLRKHYPDFFFGEVLGDSYGKLVELGVDTTRFVLLLTSMPTQNRHYTGSILISSLLTQKCITYRLGDHWSRLEGIIGNRWGAFVVSKWLNSFRTVEHLLRLGKDLVAFDLSAKDRTEGRKLGLDL